MKQRNLGLSIDELGERQAWLQNEAYHLIDAYGLFDILGIAGEPFVIGSLATGLMVWPDIDLTVVAPDLLNQETAEKIAEALVAKPGMDDVRLKDHRGDSSLNLPEGIYIGARLNFCKLDWQLDIWIVDAIVANECRSQTDTLKRELTERDRQHILAIKQVAAASDVYHRGVSSVDLYTAVLSHGVETTHEFHQWLSLSGRTL